MAGRILSRSEDTVQSDLRQMVSQWLEDSTQRVEVLTNIEHSLLEQVAVELQSDNAILTKAQAHYIKHRIDNLILKDMERVVKANPDSIDYTMELDCMSLYADIFSMFLRPGTYKL